MTIEFEIELHNAIAEDFRADMKAGLDPHFDGVVGPLGFPDPNQPVFRNDTGTVVTWEFDGVFSGEAGNGATFRGLGPFEPGTEVRFWGVHIFDDEKRVLRIVEEEPLRTQLGITDGARPLIEAEPNNEKGN